MNEMPAYNDQTPLSLAAEKENLVMVKQLLGRNPDVHFKNKYGRRSLLLTTKNGHESVVKLLLERNVNIESKDTNGSTPLSLAKNHGHEAVAELLLEHERLLDSGQRRPSPQL